MNKNIKAIVCDSGSGCVKIKSYLKTCKSVSIVGEASDQDTLIFLSQQYSIDLILINWMMENLCIKSFITLIKKLNPSVKILFFSSDEDYQEVLECIDAGFFSNVCLSNELATKLFNRASEAEDKTATNTLFLNSFSLSNREIEVLELIASGRSNNQISKELFISLATTKTHVRNILDKLGVEDRTQAAIKAIKYGIEPKVGSLVTV